jgi:hypothetical protein
LRDAGRSWGAADDDGFPAREEREQTEDDRARGPDEQDAGGCAFVATVLRNHAAYGAVLSGYTVAIIAGGALGATGRVCPAGTIH